MPHRPSPSVKSLLCAGIAALFALGCTTDPVPSECVVEPQQIRLAHQFDGLSTPLMLLPDARLDLVGDEFVLLGTDRDVVRWAVVDRTGVIVGQEHAIAVPAHRGTPWFAVAGSASPKDHLVIAYMPPDPDPVVPSVTVDLMTFAVAIDNSKTTEPVSSGQIPAMAHVTMTSGRAGMHAGVAWAVPGKTEITVRVLGGDGNPIGPDLALTSVEDWGCLRFSSGRGDFTLGYVDLSGTPPGRAFVGTEFDREGAPQPSFRVDIGKELPGCVEMAPTEQAYGLAWYNMYIGTSFTVFDPTKPQGPSPLIMSDVEFRPPPPRIAGLGWLGKYFGLVFTHSSNAEIWPLDASGRREGTLPVLPSVMGDTGSLSTQSVASAVYVTYPDYTEVARTAGVRFLVKVTCP